MDLRTKPTVEAGIVYHERAHGCELVEYQPGNGTRYVLLLSELKGIEGHTGPLGCQECSVVVSDLVVGKSMVLAPDGFLHFTYVAEKLGRQISDAIVLAELLGFLTGRAYVPCEEYERQAVERRQAG